MDSTVDLAAAFSAQHIQGPAPSGAIQRLHIPGIGPVAWCHDPGEALESGRMMFATHLAATHIRDGKVLADYDLGSGVVTIGWVNAMVTDAVAGSSVVPTLARYKYMDSGTGSTAATDGDTALQTVIGSGPARVSASTGNAQTATTSNHAAKISYTGTITYNTVGPSYPIGVTEWGLFDASSAGNLADHRVFSVVNVNSGDAILFTYTLSLPSNA